MVTTLEMKESVEDAVAMLLLAGDVLDDVSTRAQVAKRTLSKALKQIKLAAGEIQKVKVPS